MAVAVHHAGLVGRPAEEESVAVGSLKEASMKDLAAAAGQPSVAAAFPAGPVSLWPPSWPCPASVVVAGLTELAVSPSFCCRPFWPPLAGQPVRSNKTLDTSEADSDAPNLRRGPAWPPSP